ncbi:T9SS type A sorting domain-containing protein [bacterium]|nr:T9SS type A sorting domain-containing protein [bacterium]
MKKLILTLTFIFCFIINYAFCKPFTSYYHNTGSVSLRVDDQYLGGFVYHNLDDADLDNLWIAFIALYFETVSYDTLGDSISIDTTSFISSGPLFYEADSFFSDFFLESALIWEEDTISQKAELTYHDSKGFSIRQTTYSGLNDEHWIKLTLNLENVTGETVTNAKLLFFYDGDIPVDDYYDDNVGFDSLYSIVYIYDLGYDIFTGFCWIYGGNPLGIGNYEDWYGEENKEGKLIDFFNEPTWFGYSGTDCAVYQVIQLDSVISPGDTQHVEFGFIAGENVETITNAGYELHGDSSFITEDPEILPQELVMIYPNPFNQRVMIINQTGEDINSIVICNIRGEQVYSIENTYNNDVFTWHGQNSNGGTLPGGIYLIELRSSSSTITQKVLFLK